MSAPRNPPAFPNPLIELRGGQVLTAFGEHGDFGGMTLRDYFAGQALAGMLADPTVTSSAEGVAVCVYEFADAMLAERERSS